MWGLTIMYCTIFCATLVLTQQTSPGKNSDIMTNSHYSKKVKEDKKSEDEDNHSQTQKVVGLNEDAGNSRKSNDSVAEKCECVFYYNCMEQKSEEGLIDIIVQHHPCSSPSDVCCDKRNIIKDTITTEVKTGCGYRPPPNFFHTVQEDETEYGEFPWMIAVLTAKSNSSEYKCGGSLIHSSVVLTAAHCVASKINTLKIRAGEWDSQTEKENFPHQDRYVKQIITHPEYDSKFLYNDIALLLLETPVNIAKNVNVICLPHQDAVYDSSRCIVTGWGKDIFGVEGRYQGILRKKNLPIVPHEKCLKELRKTRLGNSFHLHSSFVCAGGEGGSDSCRGDGGSPLICPISGQKDRYLQMGITSWGINCGGSKTPGAYTNVAKFRNWVDSQIKVLRLQENWYLY